MSQPDLPPGTKVRAVRTYGAVPQGSRGVTINLSRELADLTMVGVDWGRDLNGGHDLHGAIPRDSRRGFYVPRSLLVEDRPLTPVEVYIHRELHSAK